MGTEFKLLKLNRFCSNDFKITLYYILILLAFSFYFSFSLLNNIEITIKSDEYPHKLDEKSFMDKLYKEACTDYEHGKYISAHEKLYAIVLKREDRNAEDLLVDVLYSICYYDGYHCKSLEEYELYLLEKYT